MDGWGRLGANMFGGSDAAYQQGVAQAVDIETKMLDARKRREQEVARSQFANALGAMGLPAQQAGAMATLLQGEVNPNQVAQGALGMQQYDQRGQLWDQAIQPGATVAGLNPMLAALQGKPVDLTKVSGGVAYNPMATPDMAQIMATPVGESQIQAQQARAAQSSAAAGAQAALARKYGAQADAGGFAPRAAGGGGGTTNTDLKLLDLLLTQEKGGDAYPDIASQGEFLEWQAQQTDPRMKDVRYAVGEFKRQRDTGMGQFFDGSGAVPQQVDLGAAAAPAAPVRARNPKTGEVVELRNGQWVPVQ